MNTKFTTPHTWANIFRYELRKYKFRGDRFSPNLITDLIWQRCKSKALISVFLTFRHDFLLFQNIK